MNIISELFGKSPFGPLVEHTKKVHECVEMVRPLMEALVQENYQELHELQDKVSKLEYEADKFKHEIRSQLPRRYFLPVERVELDNFLHCQDKIADYVQDLAVILTIRNTVVHPSLVDKYFKFVDQIFQVTATLLTAAVELQNLAEVSFGGAEARKVLEIIAGLGEEEWKADRMARSLSKDIYRLEKELDPITIIFYEKILLALGSIANEAENAGDMLRTMIIK
ncbi:MAG: TIGR00153 family protein [Proteobacteria bacterium]|nr:TIGR00153 family protein [Pseudomonadota bacterium]MBU1715530.1 TIGR00153 family protein [Pseudomonadota bacterium]